MWRVLQSILIFYSNIQMLIGGSCRLNDDKNSNNNNVDDDDDDDDHSFYFIHLFVVRWCDGAIMDEI